MLCVALSLSLFALFCFFLFLIYRRLSSIFRWFFGVFFLISRLFLVVLPIQNSPSGYRYPFFPSSWEFQAFSLNFKRLEMFSCFNVTHPLINNDYTQAKSVPSESNGTIHRTSAKTANWRKNSVFLLSCY